MWSIAVVKLASVQAETGLLSSGIGPDLTQHGPTIAAMKTEYKIGDKVKIVPFCRYYCRRAQVIHLGSDDLVGVMFGDGRAYLFRADTDLESGTTKQLFRVFNRDAIGQSPAFQAAISTGAREICTRRNSGRTRR